MGKLAKKPTEAFTLTIDLPMLSMLHDCMKFVEGRGNEEFRGYLANIYAPQEINEKTIAMYLAEFHQLIHKGMLKRAGVIPND